MQKIIFALSLFTFHFSSAQITISSTDLPSAGSMYGVTIDNSGSADFTSTGANYTWDFTSLQTDGTGIDTFFHLSDLPADFQTYFAGADMADNFSQGQSIGGFSLTGAYNAYNKLSFGFYQRGFGGTIPLLNATLPFIYVPGDQLVKFPLDFNDTYSTSCSAFATVPTVAELYRDRQRDNVVDGWGTLQLPSGNYLTLRLKSDVMDHDSIHIDIIGQDQVSDRLSHEYKWYAAGKGIPVLQINTSDNGGNETITQIIYQDPSLLPNAIENFSVNSSLQIFPNPTSCVAYILPSQNFTNEKLLITDVMGKMLLEIPASGSSAESIDFTSFAEGVYLVQEWSGSTMVAFSKLVVTH